MNISLVIPLYNEEASVDALFGSIAAQTRPPDEVVCVDAGSTDATVERIGARELPCPVRVLRRPRLGPGEARNEGVSAARHEWIAFTDGGIRLHPAWLASLASVASASGAAAVFGSYDPAYDSFVQRTAALAYVPGRSAGSIRARFVASMLVRRDAFFAAGGFPHHRAAEDLIFFECLDRAGVPTAVAPDAVVYWRTASTYAATFARFAAYSEHNLRAGRGRFWHRRLGLQSLAVGSALAVGLATGHAAAAAALVPLWLLARAVKSVWEKRAGLPFFPWSPAYVFGTALLLAVTDAATWVGAVRWLRAGRPLAPLAAGAEPWRQ